MGDDEGESDSLALDFGNHTIVPSGNGPNSTTDASQTYVRGNQTRQNAKNENNIVNNSDPAATIRAHSESAQALVDKFAPLYSENATLKARLANYESTSTGGSDSAALSRKTSRTTQASLSRESSLSQQGGVAPLALSATPPLISFSDAYFQVVELLQTRADERWAQKSADAEYYKNGFESRGDRGTDDIRTLQDKATATIIRLEAHHKTEVKLLNDKYDKFVEHHEAELRKKEDRYNAQQQRYEDTLQRERDQYKNDRIEHRDELRRKEDEISNLRKELKSHYEGLLQNKQEQHESNLGDRIEILEFQKNSLRREHQHEKQLLNSQIERLESLCFMLFQTGMVASREQLELLVSPPGGAPLAALLARFNATARQISPLDVEAQRRQQLQEEQNRLELQKTNLRKKIDELSKEFTNCERQKLDDPKNYDKEKYDQIEKSKKQVLLEYDTCYATLSQVKDKIAKFDAPSPSETKFEPPLDRKPSEEGRSGSIPTSTASASDGSAQASTSTGITTPSTESAKPSQKLRK